MVQTRKARKSLASNVGIPQEPVDCVEASTNAAAVKFDRFAIPPEALPQFFIILPLDRTRLTRASAENAVKMLIDEKDGEARDSPDEREKG